MRLLLALPKFGIVLLIAAIFAMLWLVHQNEKEEERAVLIKDVLWLEQNLRFHLNSNEEQLQQLANDLGISKDKKKVFRLRAAHRRVNVVVHARVGGVALQRKRVVGQRRSPASRLACRSPCS